MKSKITKTKDIPFNYPYCGKKEIENIKKLHSFRHYSGNGYFTQKCSKWIVKNLKCKEALLVHSCTAALEMCAILLNIKKGDEIIMPSYTFVSTANAFVLRGGIPVFVDIDPLTLNIDPKKIKSSINKKTKAILVVHYAGASCDMDSILEIAKKNKKLPRILIPVHFSGYPCDLKKIYELSKKYKFKIIEDASHAFGSKYDGKHVGNCKYSEMAIFSFHPVKTFTTGEGGVVTTNKSDIAKLIEVVGSQSASNPWHFNNLYDASSDSFFVPYHLWSGAKWDGVKSVEKCTHKANTTWKYTNARNKQTKGKIASPVKFTHPSSGKVFQTFEWKSKRGSQNLICHAKGMARIYDFRFEKYQNY